MPASEAAVLAVVKQLPPESFIRQYVAYFRKQTDTPLGFHLATTLALLGALSPTDFALQDLGGTLRTNFWSLVTGPSGSRKTWAVERGQELLQTCQSPFLGLTPDTIEGMIRLLRDKPRQLLIYPDMGDFLKRTVRPDGYSSALKEGYTRVFDSTSVGRGLAKTDVIATDVKLSLLAAVNGTYVNAFTTIPDWLGGFFGRFFVICAEREREYIDYDPPEDAERYGRLLEWLEERHGEQPRIYPAKGLTAEARQLLAEWYTRCKQELASIHIAESFVERLIPLTKRIAMLLEWDYGCGWDTQEGWKVTAATMNIATQITNLHIASVVGLLRDLAPTLEMRELFALRAACKPYYRPLADVYLDAFVGNARRGRDGIKLLEEAGDVKTLVENSQTLVRLTTEAEKAVNRAHRERWAKMHDPEPDEDSDDNVVPIRSSKK